MIDIGLVLKYFHYVNDLKFKGKRKERGNDLDVKILTIDHKLPTSHVRSIQHEETSKVFQSKPYTCKPSLLCLHYKARKFTYESTSVL